MVEDDDDLARLDETGGEGGDDGVGDRDEGGGQSGAVMNAGLEIDEDLVAEVEERGFGNGADGAEAETLFPGTEDEELREANTIFRSTSA